MVDQPEYLDDDDLFDDPDTENKRAREIQLADIYDAYRKVLSTPEGEKVFLDILKFTGFPANPVVGHTNETHERLGRKAVGLFVFSRVNGATQQNDHAIASIIRELVKAYE